MAKHSVPLQRQRRLKHVIGALAILWLLAIIFFKRIENSPIFEKGSLSSKPGAPPDNPKKPGDCYIDLQRIKSVAPGSSFLYSRWDIAVQQSKSFDEFSNKLDVPVPSFTLLETGPDETRRSLGKCSPDAKITAPIPAPVDASHMMFGVATSLERLLDSLEAFSYWAGGTHARIFAVVESGPLRETVEQRAAELEIDLTILESDREVLDRYIGLTRILLEHRNRASKWGVIMDDDTFYPSIRNLVKRLATYDTSKLQYVGALTENVKGIANYGYMAYGGAGIFLSMPLLEEMDKHYDQCAQLTDYGDKRISQCIYLYTDAKFTWDRGLHQLDFWQSDGSGFYESGRSLPLSLHHWKTTDWFPVDVIGMKQVSAVCGDDCQLNRWRISDSNDWFLINGFSVIQYSSPMEDMHGMEQTWDPSQWAREEGWAYSLGPLRPKDEAKFSLRLRHASVERDGRVRQIYVHDPGNGEPPYVLEAVWKLGGRTW